MNKIVVFIPESHKEQVKNAMFKAGAGKLGNYDSCSFEVSGTGQFRPLRDSKPYLGETDRLESVSEFRVEMVCPGDKTTEVLSAMREAHPYETPAFDVIKLEDCH
ncbi:MAG: YqfO family protein [Halobacteriovoraceae bacterium]|nr:YqfO family protein [Halobacteriovoraceae bacterium]